MRTLPLLSIFLLFQGAVFGQDSQNSSGTRLTLAEAQSLAATRAYSVRYASFDTQEAASNSREIIASGFPQVSGSIEYNRYIDIPTQVSSGDVFGFPDYLTAFLGGVAQATGVPLDAPPADPNAIQEFQFGATQTMTAGITATQLIFSPSYFVGIQAAKAYASAMEASESKSVADARRLQVKVMLRHWQPKKTWPFSKQQKPWQQRLWAKPAPLWQKASPSPPTPTNWNWLCPR